MKKKPRTGSHTASKLFSATGAILIALASLGALGGAAYYSRTYLLSDDMAAVIASVLVDLTNGDRKDEGLGTLTVNPLLAAAAQAKANDMAEKSYFAHTSPDGTTSWQWFKDVGYVYAYAGENLAVDFSDSDDVARAWMNSPTHRANVLGQNFTEIGIATAVGTYKGHTATFVVQMFGRPARATAPVAAAATVTPPPRTVKPASPRVLGTETEVETPAPVTVPAAEHSEATTTASGAPPAAVASVEEAPTYAPAWGGVATSPHAVLRVVYAASALLLLFALLITTGVEFRRHHSRRVATAAVLMLFIGSLFIVADRYIFPSPVVSQALESMHG